MVSSNSIIPQTVRRFLILVTKKCRNYAACGVSQTPTIYSYEKEEHMKKVKFLSLLLCLALILTSLSVPAEVSAAGKVTTSMTLNVTSKQTMYVGTSQKIKVKSLKPTGTSKKVTYKSSNASVVKVTVKNLVKNKTKTLTHQCC